jgi:hypothetical protein
VDEEIFYDWNDKKKEDEDQFSNAAQELNEDKIANLSEQKPKIKMNQFHNNSTKAASNNSVYPSLLLLLS